MVLNVLEYKKPVDKVIEAMGYKRPPVNLLGILEGIQEGAINNYLIIASYFLSACEGAVGYRFYFWIRSSLILGYLWTIADSGVFI